MKNKQHPFIWCVADDVEAGGDTPNPDTNVTSDKTGADADSSNPESDTAPNAESADKATELEEKYKASIKHSRLWEKRATQNMEQLEALQKQHQEVLEQLETLRNDKQQAQQQLEEARKEQRLVVELATLGYNPAVLMDSRSFMQAVQALSADDDNFSDKLTEIVTQYPHATTRTGLKQFKEIAPVGTQHKRAVDMYREDKQQQESRTPAGWGINN